MTSTLSYRKLLKLAVDVANGMAHISSQKVFVETWGNIRGSCDIFLSKETYKPLLNLPSIILPTLADGTKEFPVSW